VRVDDKNNTDSSGDVDPVHALCLHFLKYYTVGKNCQILQKTNAYFARRLFLDSKDFMELALALSMVLVQIFPENRPYHLFLLVRLVHPFLQTALHN
jgi:hypothetical protein